MTSFSNGRPAAASVHVTIGDTYNGPITSSNVGGSSNVNTLGLGTASFAKGFELLVANVAHQAFYDSGEAANPTKCHPGTRAAILADLERWAEHPEQDYPIKWVKGSAGVGKTVIMRTTAETLARKRQLLASFFFWRSGQGCSTAEHFVATVAYQICQLLPACKPLIAQVVEEDPKVFTRTMRVQVDKLLNRPIASVWRKERYGAHSALIVVIDGLDECLNSTSQSQDVERQREILLEMHQAMIYLRQQAIPLCLLIASRPERHIQVVFETDLMQDTSFVMLNESHDAADDIRRYYVDKFRAIRDRHPLRHHLPSSEWPSEDALESLIGRASGQFIYASTVMQFVGSKKNPCTQLDVIVAGNGHSRGVRPLEKLDQLYQTIFEQIDEEDWPATRRLLGILLSDAKFRTRTLLPTFWDLFLGWPSGEVERLLITLDSVVEVVKGDKFYNSDEVFHFYHASLQEFLLDPGRSGSFFVDLDSTNEEMAILCIQHLSMHDRDISAYLSLTMGEWLTHLRFTPAIKQSFIKGGIKSIYPRNLKTPYLAFIYAIQRARQRYPLDPSLRGLYEEKWDQYLRLLHDVIKQYLKESTLAYLVIVAAAHGLLASDDTTFLSSERFVGCTLDDEALQVDKQHLSLYNNYLHIWLYDNDFAGALTSILDKMPNKGVLFAEAASVFIKLLNRLEWSGYTFPFWHVSNLTKHLLENAAPSHPLRDCIKEYPIPEVVLENPGAKYTLGEINNALAEYILRVENSEAKLKGQWQEWITALWARLKG